MKSLKELEDALPRYRVCKKCGKAMPRGIAGDYCESCRSELMYHEVKEYVLNNNVTEIEVSEKFNIPLSQVREWITEGRLEYKGDWR